MTENFIVTIGSFDQESTKMIVSDPSYEYNKAEYSDKTKVSLNLVINNVLPGKWNIVLIIKDSARDRNAELICMHESEMSKYDTILDLKWLKVDTGNLFGDGIGVDSGQAGIYDLKYYRDDSLVPKDKYLPKIKTQFKFVKKSDLQNKGELWYYMNSIISTKATDYAGAVPHGAVSTSGYGDGIYSVYKIKNSKSKITMIKIVFI